MADSLPDWTKGSPTTVSGRLKKAGVSARKCRLYCVACCRMSLDLIQHQPSRELIDLAERWADDPNLEGDAQRLRRAVGKWSRAIHPGSMSVKDWKARWMAHCAADRKIVPPAQGFLKQVEFRPLLGEVFGELQADRVLDPAWLTPTVLRLAQSIYDEGAFESLPILSDALLDAGCQDPAMIAHCRSAGPHVRGCWVVDLVLGKA